MLCVVPVSIADKELLVPFLSSVLSQGECKNHKLLVVAAPLARLYATIIRADIGELFYESEVHIFDSDGPAGWPSGPNYYFSNTAQHLDESGNLLPWLWCELDSTPLKTGWLDKIENEYKKTEKLYLGVKDSFNQKVGNFSVNHNYMVGVGVYPPNFVQLTGDPQQLKIASSAFDVHYGAKVFEETAESKLIQHCYRTRNYKDTDGTYQGLHAPTYRNKNMDNPISSETVLLHGCDDGSLSKLTSRQLDPPEELDTIPTFLAIPRCGTTYTRESLRLMLRDRAVRLGVNWAVLGYENKDGPMVEFYVLNTEHQPRKTIADLSEITNKDILFICVTSFAFSNEESNLIERLSQYAKKPLRPFTFIRPPVDRIMSVSAYNGETQISKNWATSYLYFIFYGKDQTPIDGKFRAIEGLIEFNKLEVFRFPHINNVLSKLTRTNLPQFFGRNSHENKKFNARPVRDVYLPDDVSSLNFFDAALYECSLIPE